MARTINAEENAQREKKSNGFVAHIKDYCSNCTLAGFAYMANSRLHFTERIFWLICVIVSSLGCYHLIIEYQRSFPSRAVSIVYESLPPFSKWQFPSVSVCEVAHKGKLFHTMEEFIKGLGIDVAGGYPYEVESGIASILFPVLYNENALKGKCGIAPTECPGPCADCPAKDYRKILKWYGANCSDLFVECKLSGDPFDCCRYFRPLLTPYGRCYMLNSLQNNEPGSKHWLPNQLDPADRKAVITMVTQMEIQVNLMNAEDIPHTAFAPPGILAITPGLGKYMQFNQVIMTNDPDVREVDSKIRSCLFPDENPPTSVYKAYSFSVCITECIRELQMKMCNCTAFMYNPNADKRFPDCDLDGYFCLEKTRAIKPDSRVLLSNNKRNNESCGCLPSCNDGDIYTIYEPNIMTRTGNKYFNVTLDMPFLPTDQYRRQAIRSRLDVVVSMGGMLGLFLGASILSAIEFIYYFTMRPLNNMLRERSATERTNRIQLQERE
ncbi:pickpocket protein 19 [Drosophila suzukii]|uniref:Pickpocket protein 19 n=1 Tax=Drosophila suzukii TaxID=28584 RepID=A0AB40DK79_DROSZ